MFQHLYDIESKSSIQQINKSYIIIQYNIRYYKCYRFFVIYLLCWLNLNK